MPYEPFLLGVGVVFNFLILKHLKKSTSVIPRLGHPKGHTLSSSDPREEAWSMSVLQALSPTSGTMWPALMGFDAAAEKPERWQPIPLCLKGKQKRYPKELLQQRCLPNFRVNFLVRFASKPLFYWVAGDPLELLRKLFGAVRAIFWLWASFLAPDLRGVANQPAWLRGGVLKNTIIWKTWEGCGSPKFPAGKVFEQMSTLLENSSPIFREHKMLCLPRFGHFPARKMTARKLAPPSGTLLDFLLRDLHRLNSGGMVCQGSNLQLPYHVLLQAKLQAICQTNHHKSGEDSENSWI